MVKGLYTAYTGMIEEMRRMDVMTNNLANASTTGYKKEGGNKHDDAPDGMTILAENVEFIGLCKANSVRRVARSR